MTYPGLTRHVKHWHWRDGREVYYVCDKCGAQAPVPEEGCAHCQGKTWRSVASQVKQLVGSSKGE